MGRGRAERKRQEPKNELTGLTAGLRGWTFCLGLFFVGLITAGGCETALHDEGVHNDAHGDIESPPERRIFHADAVGVLTKVVDEPGVDPNEVFVEEGSNFLGNLPFHLALFDRLRLFDVFEEIGGKSADQLLNEQSRLALVCVGHEVGHGLEIVDADVDHWQLPACVLVVGEQLTLLVDGCADVHGGELWEVVQSAPMTTKEGAVHRSQEVLQLFGIMSRNSHKVCRHRVIHWAVLDTDLHMAGLCPFVALPGGVLEGLKCFVAMLGQLVAGPDTVDVEALSQSAESVSTDSSRNSTPSSEVDSLLAERDVEAMVVIRRRGRLLLGLAVVQLVVEKHILVLSDLTLGQRSRADAHNVSFQEGMVDTADGGETTASVIGISRS